MNIIKMNGITRQISILFVFCGMIVTNLLLRGSEDSNSMFYNFYTAFSPAVYAFAIWGPIFLGLALFVVYQALPAHREDKRLDAIAWPVIIAFAANALTPFVKIGVSNIMITIILISLIFAYHVIARLEPQERTFLWLVRLPIALFFGWITAATILNLFQWLSSMGNEDFGPDGTAMASLFIIMAALVGVYITIHYNEAVYGLVLLWAFWWIAAAHQSATYIVISTALSTLAIVLAILLIFTQKRLRPRTLKNNSSWSE